LALLLRNCLSSLLPDTDTTVMPRTTHRLKLVHYRKLVQEWKAKSFAKDVEFEAYKDRMESNVSNMQSQIDGLHLKLKTANDLVLKSGEEISRLEDELEGKRIEVDQLTVDMEVAEDSLTFEKNQWEKARVLKDSTIKNLNANVKKLKEDVELLNSDLKSLKEQDDTRGENENAMKGEIDCLKVEKASLKARVRKSKEALKNIEQEKGSLRVQLQKGVDLVEKLKGEKSELSEKLKQKNIENTMLKSDIESAENVISSEAEERLVYLESVRQSLGAADSNVTLQECASNLNSKCARLQCMLDDTKKAMKLMQRDRLHSSAEKGTNFIHKLFACNSGRSEHELQELRAKLQTMEVGLYKLNDIFANDENSNNNNRLQVV